MYIYACDLLRQSPTKVIDFTKIHISKEKRIKSLKHVTLK